MSQQLGNFSLRRITALLLCGVALVTSGCGQLFQQACQPASPAVRNLEDATWRLTYTNNPAQRYRQYDFIYSFEILAFTRQFQYNIRRVIRNTQFNNAIQQGDYDTDGRSTLVMQSTTTTSGDGTDNGDGSSGGGTVVTGEATFNFSLGSHLELRDRKTGYIYRYVQFTGVVSPSTACVFK